MSSIRLKIPVMISGAVVAMCLGGCTIAPVASQSTALTTATTQFEAVVAAASPIGSAEATLTEARMLEAAYGGSIQPLVDNCGDSVGTLQKQYTNAVAAGQPSAALDPAYKALLAFSPCGPMLASAATSAAAPNSQLDVLTSLNGYFDAINSVTAAKDAQSFDTAATSLSTSIASVAKAVGGSAKTQSIPQFISQLAQTAVQQAEYETLKLFVPQMDSLLANAEAPIISALRVQQSFYLTVVTMDAQEGIQILNRLYAKDTTKNSALVALTLYAASQPIIVDFETEQTSARTDPATAVDKLLSAHHALALALQSGKGELSAIVTSATSIGTNAQTLLTPMASASNTAATTKKGGK